MSKYSAELKIAACKDFLSGELSLAEVCEKYGIYYDAKECSSRLRKWCVLYEKNGESAFLRPEGSNIYTASFKEKVVLDYLSGEGSFLDIAAKYNISNDSTVRQWVLMYNANRELKDYCPKREVYMADARRKTTIEERKEIVEYCINHNRDYKEAASIYGVSYSQVYSWMKKYDEKGEVGLVDKRGHHKSDDELSELERLQRENMQLKKQLKEKEMLAQLLKKVQELEGM